MSSGCAPWPIFPICRLILHELQLSMSPRRVLDAAYQTFFDLVAGHIGTTISDARAYEAERR
jgi:hypothetical protein